MSIGFDLRVYRGGTIVYNEENKLSFPYIENGERVAHINYYHNNRGYDHDLMHLYGWLKDKREETVNLNGYPCLFTVRAGWIRAYGISIPEGIPNNEPLWVEMWDQS